MASTDDRAQFKVASEVRGAVRHWAVREEISEAAAWRRVVKAGLATLGLDVGLASPAISDLRQQMDQVTPPRPAIRAAPPPQQIGPPAGWDDDPLGDIA